MKNKTTQGLGNKNLLSFPKHEILKTKLSTVICQCINIIYLNHFLICQEANGVSKESTC